MSQGRGAGWQIRVDTGGTFTDCLAIDPAGRRHRAKVLSSSALRAVRVDGRADEPEWLSFEASWHVPDGFCRGARLRWLADGEASVDAGGDHGGRVVACGAAGSRLRLDRPAARPPGTAFELRFAEEAPLLAARLVTATPAGEPLPDVALRLATTRGTNALLERRGAPTALFVTRGFASLLRIGDQRRPDLFALGAHRPAPLPAAVVEVDERLAADGAVVRPLDLGGLPAAVESLRAAGVEAAAVALLHSYRNPEHERRLTAELRRLGLSHVSASADLAPVIEIVPRAETAVVDAYLSPSVGDYLARLGGAVSRLQVMTSAGGLMGAAAYRPKDSLLSGPAGGVVGAVLGGREHARGDRDEPLVLFDMGGTSTDVSRWGGDFDHQLEHRVGGARVAAPALAIETVAAGGGSLCQVVEGQLKVGPESAGANPGPACYGAGGGLTLTDVNLLLGRIDPRRFALPIDLGAARRALATVREELAEADDAATDDGTALLAGFLAIADERMAGAVRRISVARGYDPRDHALVAFGGAGGQHACAVAEELGIRRIVMPADAGLLSAVGLDAAVVERDARRQVLRPLARCAAGLRRAFDDLAREASARVVAEGVAADAVEIRQRRVRLRLAGQESVLELDAGEAPFAAAFRRRYRQVYGYELPARALEVESLRVVASSRPALLVPATIPDGGRPARPARRQRAWLGGWLDCPVYDGGDLVPGDRLTGPALVVEDHATLIVAPGWTAVRSGTGGTVLERPPEAPAKASRRPVRSPRMPRVSEVELELFTHRFAAVAAEMGAMLQRTALSTNVRDRLDFSCALLDADARLVVNAPHIPVHLGALGLCVRRVRDALPLSSGDVAVTNHPAFGGSHLPDVTVITPVDDADGYRLGYVASRAHHAEIGGSRPGSMPPDARCLAEEGVVIPPSYLVRDGRARWPAMRRRLAGGPFPSRAVEENLADLAAAVAANHRGARVLAELARRHGREAVARAMHALAELAADRVTKVTATLPATSPRVVEKLDDGTPIAVTVGRRGDRLQLDFSGSGAAHPGNLNATPAIVRSAVLYVLRLLLAEERALPLNEGLLNGVDIVLPEGVLNPAFADDPRRAPAVVGGNVETSQRLVDALIRAFGLAACSQGTMNNLLFGNERFGYYETVCGGAGAGPGFAGESAVHTHMTNTRITDPEVLELRYPVRLERFALRRGSGGAGRWPGGEGVVRELRFLAPVALSLLSQHRVEAPYGAEGGSPGARGAQRLVRNDGTVEELAGSAAAELVAGDRLILETPGGGGWGVAVVGGDAT